MIEQSQHLAFPKNPKRCRRCALPPQKAPRFPAPILKGIEPKAIAPFDVDLIELPISNGLGKSHPIEDRPHRREDPFNRRPEEFMRRRVPQTFENFRQSTLDPEDREQEQKQRQNS